MRGHGRLLTTAGLIAAGALTACSGASGTSQGTATATHELPPATSGTSAAAPTSTSASAPATTSPTVAAPTATSAAAPAIPAAARAHTPEGAEAFTRYFIDQVNVAWTTPKTGLISALSLPTCKSCANLERGARDLETAKARYSKPVLSADEVESSLDPAGKTVVQVSVVETPVAVLQGNKTTPPEGTPTTAKRAFHIEPSGEGWKVAEIRDLV